MDMRSRVHAYLQDANTRSDNLIKARGVSHSVLDSSFVLACKVLMTTRLARTMIRNLNVVPELAADIVNVEETITLMTNALDLYCDQLIADTRHRIIAPKLIEEALTAVIGKAIEEGNPHLKDKFYIHITREDGDNYMLNIEVQKSPIQQHLELISGSMLCH